ncbi:hypothetical protein QYE76_061474 [Lolium multiflorum]|uniref:Arabidopsis retrotransposon Orf1 C-terminal domain-containing protein n=1 Tax=Lolium multiflorum TaxID=4521 RepID=A0AAD8W775_LOLMU|nr:hypothetical protein QYE76_061474 [Lolium multiflorum]
MGKSRDPKVVILPSTTRKGTTLSTSAALDSPSVISQLVSPPQASLAGTSAESENSYNFDDASAVLGDSGSLGSFLDATIARSRQIENTETPNENTVTPVNSPESIEYSSDDPDEDYVELDDDFIVKCNATTDAMQNDLLKNSSKEKHAYEVTTRGGVSTQDPLYPEGHPKRVEQDSQRIETSAPSKKKKKKHKNVVESSEPVNDPNSISISDAETESGNKHDKDNDKNDASDKEEVEDEPKKHAKNKKYTKEDFIAKKHGNEREPWVQKQMPFPAKKLKSKEEEHYNKFCDWMKPLFLQIPLTDAIKLPPYSKYMKDIVSNKRKIPNEEISTMLANYSFNGKVPKKLGDPDKLIPIDISLQMADKSTAIPVGICEDVPVQVTNNCLILTDFVVLEMPEDDNMSIILGRPFLNTAGAVIDCNKGKVTFNVDDKEHTVYFPKRIDKFNNKHYQPSVAFRIYGNPITMKLKDFCTALDIAPVGTTKKIENNPKALLELYREVTNDDSRTIQRGKIRNIQLPAIRYFAYYLATSILGRENTSNIFSYHLSFLVAALTGETPYHLGALVARRLSNKGPIFGEIVASRILAYLDLPLDPTDVKLTPIRLDIAATKSHQFVTTDSSLDNIVYRMLFTDGDEREIPLPQPDLFDIYRKPWSRSKAEVDEQLKIHGFHQQHDSEDTEPSHGYTVMYPGASSSTYPEQDPSSSYYGGATSWAPWD